MPLYSVLVFDFGLVPVCGIFIVNSAAANEKSWVAQGTTHLVLWVVCTNFGLSDMHILINTKSEMDFGKRNSRVASRTCSWEYLGRPAVL